MNLLQVKPPRIALLSLLIALLLHWLTPTQATLANPFRVFGLISFLVGFGLMLWAWRLFQQHGTVICPTEIPTALVEEGPFRFSRNPMYLGIVLMLVGIALSLGTLVMFFAPTTFFLIMDRCFVLHEEKNLEAQFGERYLNYKRQVRRWI